ncbi:hypothetical protein E0W68_08365 [Flavobacterium salilacus subsp. salilacus]|uniref:hypothetical protein n=1 Tax=Flavobacterium TaxID=237 RepID=UPI00107520BE|nr:MULTISPECIES: hypothetical protein [Flavobacterium]KAF2518754.1 hypothetical protein E0W68_08365 [Flavobacterium salilacus subsp. salilacus]MBE1613721.1 hypothetical protein [Flavobacterium sp. SaA2.13]NDI99040.1 hypothetical protein [Flavobacterium salilacus subsp. altitudinum]
MDRQMYHYAPVAKALTELKEKGYTTDFNLQEARIINNYTDFVIEEVYRYEGETDPADEATVYGIKSSDGEKGVFVAGHGAYSEKSAAMVLHQMTIKDRDQKEE